MYRMSGAVSAMATQNFQPIFLRLLTTRTVSQTQGAEKASPKIERAISMPAYYRTDAWARSRNGPIGPIRDSC
jgi:hypothetical protein